MLCFGGKSFGDDTAALDMANEALALSPDDANLLAFKGVLQIRLGAETAAATTFTAAEVAAGSREQYFLNRAQVYLVLGQSEAVLADAEAAIAASQPAIGARAFVPGAGQYRSGQLCGSGEAIR